MANCHSFKVPSPGSEPGADRCTFFFLVYTLEGRNGLALGLIERRGNDATVRQVDLAVGALLERQSVLHPFLVVTFGEVLAGVGTTRLLAGGGGGSGLGTMSAWLASIIVCKEIWCKLTRK